MADNYLQAAFVVPVTSEEGKLLKECHASSEALEEIESIGVAQELYKQRSDAFRQGRENIFIHAFKRLRSQQASCSNFVATSLWKWPKMGGNGRCSTAH